MNTDWNDLIQRHIAGLTTDDEAQRLSAALKADDTLADLYIRHIGLELALEAKADSVEGTRELLASLPITEPKRGFTWLSWRPLAAAAAGIIIGLFSASIVGAVSSPRTTTERLFSLINGGFEENRLKRGFPHQTGLWSGDEAAISNGKLSFIAPESDPNDPNGRAIACDVFQLVDLRTLPRERSSEREAVLELSTTFLDARPHNSQPSVTFFCQLYLFHGDPGQMHQSWPQGIPEALASGSAQVTTLGTDAKGARHITARCLLPAEADFAVIQIAARPNLRPAKLESLFAADVKLTLKTSPELPTRIVQR